MSWRFGSGSLGQTFGDDSNSRQKFQSPISKTFEWTLKFFELQKESLKLEFFDQITKIVFPYWSSFYKWEQFYFRQKELATKTYFIRHATTGFFKQTSINSSTISPWILELLWLSNTLTGKRQINYINYIKSFQVNDKGQRPKDWRQIEKLRNCCIWSGCRN